MNRDQVVRFGRRGAVAVATAGVLVVGAATVQVAAEWRASSAQLDVAPVGMETIGDAYSAETVRTTELAGQVDEIAGQLADLKSALIAADDAMTDDQAQAEDLQRRLDSSKDRLETLQRQLKAANARLNDLNRAAARQAALNRQASVRSAGTSASTSPHDDDHDDDDEEEDDD
jgi:chromosome segregation ATPase